MAKRTETITHFIDDLDGSKGDRTVRFGFEGVSYEIDLSKKNASALEKALKPYIDAGRKLKTPRGRTGSSKGGSSRERLQEIRKWARSQGKAVSDRGRIPASLLEEYEAAH